MCDNGTSFFVNLKEEVVDDRRRRGRGGSANEMYRDTFPNHSFLCCLFTRHYRSPYSRKTTGLARHSADTVLTGVVGVETSASSGEMSEFCLERIGRD